jgi:hypothetical protein
LLFTLLVVTGLFAQETTGGLQGTVKDLTGAVVQGAKITLTGTNLTGAKEATSDANGYYRFANLPPGSYTVNATAQGFTTLRREGITIEVGHLPTLDLSLQVGGSGTVVEVTGEAPLIDVTTTRTMTNITSDVINDVPHGASFQSVIQFAPSARNEPLQGSNRLGTGNGGDSPGNGSNGGQYGFSVAGGADSENSYLVEGQETASIIGGFSHTNVPFDFIQEVQVKTSGIEAEHGGSLGGVANVVMKKGSSKYHGSLFAYYQNQAMNGSPVGYERKDPTGLYQNGFANGNPLLFTDTPYQNYQPIRPTSADVFPGFTFGGPLLPKWKDKAYVFLGFNPEFTTFSRSINYAAGGNAAACPNPNGICTFSQNTQTYYTTARIDVAATQKIRVFGSWLYQYQRQAGENLPASDSVNGLYNLSTGNDPSAYAHNLGYTAPNITMNTGVDWTITQHMVSTTRFGYYFENFADFGFPTSGTIDQWVQNGVGQTDTLGNPLPASLAQATGTLSNPYNPTLTSYNANKAIQLDQDFAWYKSGWGGIHNFKFGYQLNRLSNFISQHANEPVVNIYPGAAQVYGPALSTTGIANCAAIQAATPGATGCQGQYGYMEVYDTGNGGKATSYNHSFFAQDAWTIGHGITIDAGIRVEHENLPGEFDSVGVAHPPSGFPANPISFGWGSKVAPRIGAAWDVFRDGRMKIFGSYGHFYDQMKLNLAISSFGGQYWDSCFYALNTSNVGSIMPQFDSANRFCPQDTTGTLGANWQGGAAPAGTTFIENVNYRISTPTCTTCNPYQEGVAPNLKPYHQHEAVFGIDYQLSKGLAVEARWDRRRLDSAIEDSAIENSAGNETFVIVNPGLGVNSNFQGFCQFLYAKDPSPSADCANTSGQNPNFGIFAAARSYDGLEFRLTKAQSNHWFGMFSYTYSKFRGNYTGLTSSELSDGGLAGRNSPNNSRAFDEPYFSYNSNGGSSSGLLPTDRPNAFKGYAYYELGWLKHFTTDFGLFQYAYSGSPNSTYVDAGAGAGAWAIYPFNRGEWANFTQDPTTGAITFGTPYVNRTPWYTQSDFSITQNYKISESKSLSFSAIATNLWNQHSVTALYSQLDSNTVSNYIRPVGPTCGRDSSGNPIPGGCFIGNGVDFYQQIMNPYSLSTTLNNFKGTTAANTVVQLNSAYGKPMYYQLARNIRLGVRFTF